MGCQNDEKKIAWVAWDKVLASKDRGGLGIGSLASFNLALLKKWRWRFYNESEAIWCRVIKAIHGDQGGVANRNDQRIRSGMWSRIVGSINYLHDSNVIDYNTLRYSLVGGIVFCFGWIFG